MHLALAHDYLTQRGGAERVALELTRIFPDAPMYTSVYEPGQTYEGFEGVDVRTTWLQRVPMARRDPRLALLGLPRAWDSVETDADVVLASSTGFAHGIPTQPGTRKIVYCHNPARWLYQADEYLPNGAARRVFDMVRPYLMRWDQEAARSADTYLVNSSVVAQRVEEAYGITPEVVHPPVSIDTDGEQIPVPGVEPGYWLTIARGRGYKNVDAIVEGTRELPGSLVVAGSGADQVNTGDAPHVQAVGVVPEGQLRWLYANARALVSVSHEDFGLTPLEANAFGTPAAVLKAGGFLDSMAEGVSGEFIEEPTAEAVHDTLEAYGEYDATGVRNHAAAFSTPAFVARLTEVIDELPAGSVSGGVS